MAESRGSLLAKSVQKHAGRAKEKILQNLGKVDRTADEIFDEHLQNFTRQQNGANRLQKEFNNYIRCVRACQAASKSLLEAVGEIYENQWTGHDLLYLQIQSADMLWQDFSHKLADQVLLPLNTYQGQFPEMRKKIDKRGRKLVDFDSQRHSFQALQTNMKKRDDVKISKGREQLEDAKRTYEILNSELHDELPALYDSRVLFLVTNLQSLFSAEQVFHSETSKIFGELEAIVDKLATDSQRGSYSVKKTNGSSLPHSTSNYKTSQLIINNISPNSTLNTPTTPTKKDKSNSLKNDVLKPPPSPEPIKKIVPDSLPLKKETTPLPVTKDSSSPTTPVSPVIPASPKEKEILPPSPTNNVDLKETPSTNGTSVTDSKTPSPEPLDNKPAHDAAGDNTTNGHAKIAKIEEMYDIPEGASTDNLPSGVLYRVKATYKYNREDVDELSFDVGEIINVVEYDDPEEQEEGWLMGVKEGTRDKGMFPANFTRPL